jgi:hypothetical protein
MADWLESFKAVRVLIRFGMWENILQLDLPQDPKLYCVTMATNHYAKGVAWAATGNLERAERERSLFLSAVKHVPCTHQDFPNKCVDILAVGAAMLDGEIEYRRGNFDAAFESLRKSIILDDGLVSPGVGCSQHDMPMLHFCLSRNM